MDPFEVYKIYLALKLHFTTESYDITKHKFAAKGKKETFMKRKDLIVLRKLARDFDRQTIIDILVANFVRGDRWGGMFDTESMKTYERWKARQQSMGYTFEQDLNTIQTRMDIENIEKIESAAYRRLIKHLQKRTDVQNIDVMELAVFCRNCLSRWMSEEAEKLIESTVSKKTCEFKGVLLTIPCFYLSIYRVPYYLLGTFYILHISLFFHYPLR